MRGVTSSCLTEWLMYPTKYKTLLFGKAVFLGWDFAIQTVSVETVINLVLFGIRKLQIQNLQLKRVPYNKLLTNLHVACSSDTGEYCPSVIFVTTLGQYSPVWPLCSVIN